MRSGECVARFGEEDLEIGRRGDEKQAPTFRLGNLEMKPFGMLRVTKRLAKGILNSEFLRYE